MKVYNIQRLFGTLALNSMTKGYTRAFYDSVRTSDDSVTFRYLYARTDPVPYFEVPLSDL